MSLELETSTTGSPKAAKYRALAVQMRAQAEQTSIPQAKEVLLEIADGYGRLAATLDANACRQDA